MGYDGRLRAAGPLIADQFRFARRVGFDEVELPEAVAERQPEEQWRIRDRDRYQDHLHAADAAPAEKGHFRPLATVLSRCVRGHGQAGGWLIRRDEAAVGRLVAAVTLLLCVGGARPRRGRRATSSRPATATARSPIYGGNYVENSLGQVLVTSPELPIELELRHRRPHRRDRGLADDAPGSGTHWTLEPEVGMAQRFGRQDATEVWGAFFFRYHGFPWDHRVLTTFAVSTGLNWASEVTDVEQDRANDGKGSQLHALFRPGADLRRSGASERRAGASACTTARASSGWSATPGAGRSTRPSGCASASEPGCGAAPAPAKDGVSDARPSQAMRDRTALTLGTLLPGVLAMAVIVIVSNILVQFLVGDWLTWGAFTYPFAFLVTDLMNRFYGPRAARRVVLAGFVVGLVCSFVGAPDRGAVRAARQPARRDRLGDGVPGRPASRRRGLQPAQGRAAGGGRPSCRA